MSWAGLRPEKQMSSQKIVTKVGWGTNAPIRKFPFRAEKWGGDWQNYAHHKNSEGVWISEKCYRNLKKNISASLKNLAWAGFSRKTLIDLVLKKQKKMLWLRRTHVSQKAAISGKLMQDDWIRPGKKSVKVSRNGERAWLIKKNVVQRAHKIVIHKDAWLSYC